MSYRKCCREKSVHLRPAYLKARMSKYLREGYWCKRPTKERGNHRIQAYLSFIQHKNSTPYIGLCNLLPVHLKQPQVNKFQGLQSWFRCQITNKVKSKLHQWISHEKLQISGALATTIGVTDATFGWSHTSSSKLVHIHPKVGDKSWLYIDHSHNTPFSIL